MTNYKGGAIADLKVCSTQGQVKKKAAGEPAASATDNTQPRR